MAIEVEQKFRVRDREAIARLLAELAAAGGAEVVQVDCYFAHPSRDFADSDEALRVRRQNDLNYLTYKGPKLDQTTKTRREIEIELAPGERAAADAMALFSALGFSRVADVCKTRLQYTVAWQGREIAVSVDEVAEIGGFVELEIVADNTEIDEARTAVASLAERMGLGDGERRSYLELLLASRRT